MKSKFMKAGISLVAVVVCLCFAQGAGAQSAKTVPPVPGVNSFAGAGAAGAGCANFDGNTPAAPARPENNRGHGNSESGKPRLVLTSWQEPRAEFEGSAGIVGLWSVTFTSEGSSGIPDGTVIDQGYTTWHADGTEIMNSGRPPITGNFCMGVWRQTSRFSYKLNHVTLSWDPTGTIFVGPGNIKEQITLSHGGNSYSGSFTIDQFDTNGNLLQQITGNVSATRITVD